MALGREDLGLLDGLIDTMGRPDSGVPEAEDPFYGVDYEKDLYDVDLDMEVPQGVPQACLWRVLIMPARPRTMSRGGIALPSKVMEAEEHLNYIGRVVNKGPLAGKSPKFINPDWDDSLAQHIKNQTHKYLWDIKVGDWVIYGRYTGQKCWFKGAKMIFVNDDEILGKAEHGPAGFKVYAA